jgi:hypothetical protein
MDEASLKRAILKKAEGREEREQCMAALFDWKASHRLAPSVVNKNGVQSIPSGFILGLRMADLSTTDSDELTRLVLVAHRHSVRISIAPRSAYSIEIAFTARSPKREEGSSFMYHPDLLSLSDRAREWMPLQETKS